MSVSIRAKTEEKAEKEHNKLSSRTVSPIVILNIARTIPKWVAVCIILDT